ncbi:urease subunit gamma/beta [Wenyingzhuangia heitensis]|uniref:urease n=1 Tax=Wenyingzhuangia heitensis TaxID=1487859 RepID=A0ABX0UG19_9FLAO|nr:urease subunit gamma [Wenyingzhuangia heitensis]NIJ45962.1 urease subunit gamma/beta [Wenyingzhuangia heitensis]
MHLSPKEIDKLMLHNAGVLAQKRYARGILLNYPETIALISTQLLEFIREGVSVVELMDRGKKIIGCDEVMPGIEKMIHDVQIEGTFPDGTKLVTVHEPVCDVNLNNDWALYGSGLQKTKTKISIDNVMDSNPGAMEIGEGVILLNENRKTIDLDVTNIGDRPIQVGSHYNFIDVNIGLKFNREASIGYRLNIPAGTAIRFEPGETKNVELVEVSGSKIIYGGNNFVNGCVDDVAVDTIMDRVNKQVN